MERGEEEEGGTDREETARCDCHVEEKGIRTTTSPPCEDQSVVFDERTYEPLAPGSEWPRNGEFDAIVLGTGLTNSLLCALLAVYCGWKVLHIDKERHYGGPTASLNLDDLFRRSYGRKPNAEEIEILGKSSLYNVDLVPKAMLSCGKLAKMLVGSQVVRYLGFRRIGGTYMYKGSNRKLHRVPATAEEAIRTDMMGWFQKRRFRNFLSFVEKCDVDDPSVIASLKYDIHKMSAGDLFSAFGLGPSECDLAGHVLGLQRDDSYLQRPAIAIVRNIRLYVISLNAFGRSPYIYPEYGLGQLAEGCCRLCTINRGIYLLDQKVDEILFDKRGVARGVRCGKKAALAKRCIISESSYLPRSMLRCVGRVVRSVCILDHPIPNIPSTESCQIVYPQRQLARGAKLQRRHDVFVSCVSHSHFVSPRGRWLALLSTVVETNAPSEELEICASMLGPILKRFDSVTDMFVAAFEARRITDGEAREEKDKEEETGKSVSTSGVRVPDSPKNLFVCKPFDATSSFESVATDVVEIWTKITGEKLDIALDTDICRTRMGLS